MTPLPVVDTPVDLADIKVPDTSVVVVYPTRGDVALQFHHAIADVERFDRAQGFDNFAGELVQQASVNISKARNELVRRFLEGPWEWAWFLDDDMVPKPDTLPRLLCSATAADAKIVGGLCVMVGADGPIPTIYQLGNLARGEITRVAFDYQNDALVQVVATGTGCLLIHRDVFEAIAAADPDNPFPWFAEKVINGNWTSEDLVFCLRANELGFRIFVDTGAPVGHRKGGEVWWPHHIREGKGFPRQRTAVIIPVKDRLDLTSSIVAQLRALDGVDDIIILDNGSKKKTANWLASQPDLVVESMPGEGIHRMWNRGAELALERSNHQKRNLNLVYLNNDLDLGPDFIRRLVSALRSEGRLAAMSANYDGRDIDGIFEPTTDICAGRYDGTGGLAGFAFAVKGEWIHSGYLFPEECRWWYGDNDLVMTIEAAGWLSGISADARVTHLDGGSQTGGDWSDKADELAADREAFEDRWRRLTAPAGPVEVDVEASYATLLKVETDIKGHLPTLVDLVVEGKAEKVIELGVRSGVSTVAFLKGLDETNGHLWSVDISPAPFTHDRLTFTQGDDLDPYVMGLLPDDADVVFIDTSHAYRHTLDELRAYVRKLKPRGCFVLHDVDVERHEHLGDDEPAFPVRKAVEDFVREHGGAVAWHEGYNGLAVVVP